MDGLTPARQAAFAKTLQKAGALQVEGPHYRALQGQGIEQIPVGQLTQPMPVRFQNQGKVMVFRYDRKLPMVGVRVDDVDHVLFVEPEFNMLYGHG